MKIKIFNSQKIHSSKAICGFTARSGGFSQPPFDSLNLGIKTPDENVEKNYFKFFKHIKSDPKKAAFMEQVHGSNVSIVDKGGCYQASDSLITKVPGILLCVQVADCIPMLLYDNTGKAAAVHCGWRPIAGNIIEKTLSAMSDTFGSFPENITAVIGPSVGSCCYEIGDDVASMLSAGAIIERNRRLYGDLKKEAEIRLRKLGVKENSIEKIDKCTFCDKSLFYSYRRDGNKSGRMIGFIAVKQIFEA